MCKKLLALLTTLIFILTAVNIPSFGADEIQITVTHGNSLYNSSCVIHHVLGTTGDSFNVSVSYAKGISCIRVKFPNKKLENYTNKNILSINIDETGSLGTYQIVAIGKDGVSTELSVNVVLDTPATTGITYQTEKFKWKYVGNNGNLIPLSSPIDIPLMGDASQISSEYDSIVDNQLMAMGLADGTSKTLEGSGIIGVYNNGVFQNYYDLGSIAQYNSLLNSYSWSQSIKTNDFPNRRTMKFNAIAPVEGTVTVSFFDTSGTQSLKESVYYKYPVKQSQNAYPNAISVPEISGKTFIYGKITNTNGGGTALSGYDNIQTTTINVPYLTINETATNKLNYYVYLYYEDTIALPTPTPTPLEIPSSGKADFQIISDNINYTDSTLTKNVLNSNYGQTYNVDLVYAGSLMDVSKIEWVNPVFPAEKYTISNPSIVNKKVMASVKGSSSGYQTFYDMQVTYNNGTSKTVTHSITVKEISVVATPTPTPTPTATPTPTPTPTPEPEIPVAIINCPVEVGVGETFRASLATSYAKNGATIVKWFFDYSLDDKNNPSPVTATFTETNPDATFKAMKPGILYIRGYVVDSNGLKSWYSQKVKVTVSEPEPYISLNVPDHQKELRKFTVDLSGSGTTCDNYYSSFTPITGHYTEMAPAIDWTLTNVSIKTETDFDIVPFDQVYYEYWDENDTRHIGQYTSDITLCGAKKYNIMAKKAIKLKITGTAYDILGRASNSDTRVINITPDLPPIANIDYPSKGYRDHFNAETGKFEDIVDIVDLSYSPDEDYFEYRRFYYVGDFDCDGNFNEETPILIDNPTNDRHIQMVYQADQLYCYQYFVEVKEALPDEDTIPEYINPEDYKVRLGVKAPTKN